MFKVIGFVFMVIAQMILNDHGLSFTNWEWWALTFCLLSYDFFWRFDE